MSDIYKAGINVGLTGAFMAEMKDVIRLLGTADKGVETLSKRLAGLKVPPRIAGELANIGIEAMHVAGGLKVNFGESFKAIQLDAAKAGKVISVDMAKTFKTVNEDALRVTSTIANWGKEANEAAAKINAAGKVNMAAASAGPGGRSLRHGSGGGGSIFGRMTDTLAMGPTESGFLAGMGVGKLPLSMLHANATLQGQVNQYRLAGASALDVNEGINAAFRSATQVPDVGVSEQFKILRELASATGDDSGARKMLPDAARSLSMMSTITGKHGDEDMKKLFKFIELRGVAIDEHSHKIDTGKFGAELDYATKAMIAAQGLITPNDMLQFAKQAGSMAKGMSGEQLFSTMLASMEDMGGARTGTSLTAVGRQFLGGIMTGTKADRLDELKLLNKEGVDRTGPHAVVNDPVKGIVGYDVLANQGFGAFVDKIIRPHFAAAGITERQAQNNELYRSVGTDTARRQIGLFLSGQEQVSMVADRYHKAMSGAEGYNKIYGAGQDYNTSAKAFEESFTTLKAALGDAQGVAPMLMTLAKGISGFADAVRVIPGMGAGATFGTLAGSAGLMAYGGKQFMTGFGLPGAAAQLTAAAVELQGAALKLGGGNAAGGDAVKKAAAAGLLAPVAIGGALAVAGAYSFGAAATTYPAMERRKPGTLDPATGVPLDANPMAGVGASIRSWWKGSPDTSAAAVLEGMGKAANTAGPPIRGASDAMSGAASEAGKLEAAIRSLVGAFTAAASSANSAAAAGAKAGAAVGKQSSLGKYPTVAGGMDTRGAWRAPSDRVTDAG